MEFEDFYPAELRLLEAVRSSRACRIDEGKSPDALDAGTYRDRWIRASTLRSIILGHHDCGEPQGRGIEISGAFISGDLDLFGQNICCRMHFENCIFTGQIILESASIQDLVLKGTKVYHLNMDAVTCRGNIILSYGFQTNSPVFLRWAKVSGQVGCSGGQFSNYQLAMSMESTVVEGNFFWRLMPRVSGMLDLTNARVGTLIDDPASWPIAGKLRLDGFCYNSLGSNTHTDFYNRLGWLERQYEPHLTYDFRPQPFEQLKRVLLASGWEEEYKRVAIRKLDFQKNATYLRRNPKLLEIQSRLAISGSPQEQFVLSVLLAAEKQRMRSRHISNLAAQVRWIWQTLFGLFFGYGYRPFRSIFLAAVLVLSGAVVFSHLYEEGLIQGVSDHFATQFSAIAYSTDIFLPVLNLGVEREWQIVQTADGRDFRLFSWGLSALGWVITAIFGASLTGLIRK